jgi:hypothetical protein
MNGELADRAIGPSGDRAVEQKCAHLHITVVATWRSGHIIKRRRLCLDCREKFSTDEKLPFPGLTATNGDNLHCHVKIS